MLDPVSTRNLTGVPCTRPSMKSSSLQSSTRPDLTDRYKGVADPARLTPAGPAGWRFPPVVGWQVVAVWASVEASGLSAGTWLGSAVFQFYLPIVWNSAGNLFGSGPLRHS